MLIWKDFQDILNGNFRQSLGLVEGKLSGRSFHQVWLSTTIQGFLERKEQPPWEEVVWDDPYQLLTSSWLLVRGWGGWTTRELQLGPFLGQSNLILIWGFVTSCSPSLLSGSKVGDHNSHKTKARHSAAWWLKEVSDLLLPVSSGEDKFNGFYPTWVNKNLPRATWGSGSGVPPLAAGGTDLPGLRNLIGASGWETFKLIHIHGWGGQSAQPRAVQPGAPHQPSIDSNAVICSYVAPLRPLWAQGWPWPLLIPVPEVWLSWVQGAAPAESTFVVPFYEVPHKRGPWKAGVGTFLVVQWLRHRWSRGHGFDTWSGKIPYDTEQLSLCTTATGFTV